MKFGSALYTVSYLILLGFLNTGHYFFSVEEIQPFNEFSQKVKDSYYSWNFFFYEFFQSLSPVVTFFFIYILFDDLYSKNKLKLFNHLKNIFFLIGVFHIYKVRVILKLDTELDLSDFYILENYLVTLGFSSIALIMTKTHALSLVGYESISDLASTAVAYKQKAVFLYGALIAGILTGLESLVSSYIYDPSFGVYVMWLCAILDIILGAAKAKKNGEYDVKKFRRGWVAVIICTILIALLNGAVKTYDLLNDYITQTAMIGMTLSFLISAECNAYELGLVKEDVHKVLQNVLQLGKILKKKKIEEDDK